MRRRPAVIAGISFALVLPVAVSGAGAAWDTKGPAHFVDAGWGPSAYGRIWPDVQEAIDELGITRPHVRILANRVWPVGAAIVLRLTKSEFNLSVDPRWWFMFGDLPEGGGGDGMVIVGTYGSLDDLHSSSLHRSRLIRSSTSDVLVSDAPQISFEGAIFFADPAIELFLRDGFSKPFGDPGTGFRSSSRPTSSMLLPVANSSRHLLELEVAPYPIFDQVQTLEFEVDGEMAGVVTLSDTSWSRVTCELPARSGISNRTVLIRYGHTEKLPRSRTSQTQSHRAVRFRSMRIVPIRDTR